MRTSHQRRGSPAVSHSKLQPSGSFRIPTEAHGLKPSELPISVRLENVLRSMGVNRLGGLDGVPVSQFCKERNCGKRTVEELGRLLERIGSGEFQEPRKAFSVPDTAELLDTLDAAVEKLPLPRDQKIFLLRMGAETAD